MVNISKGAEVPLFCLWHQKHGRVRHFKKITTFQPKTERVMTTQAMSKIIADYFKTQPVVRAWLFGSFARGEETPLSDVDLLVVLDHSQPIGLKFFGMWKDLEDLLDREVDLVEEGTLMPFAVDSANNDKKLIYERTA